MDIPSSTLKKMAIVVGFAGAASVAYYLGADAPIEEPYAANIAVPRTTVQLETPVAKPKPAQPVLLTTERGENGDTICNARNCPGCGRG